MHKATVKKTNKSSTQIQSLDELDKWTMLLPNNTKPQENTGKVYSATSHNHINGDDHSDTELNAADSEKLNVVQPKQIEKAEVTAIDNGKEVTPKPTKAKVISTPKAKPKTKVEKKPKSKPKKKVKENAEKSKSKSKSKSKDSDKLLISDAKLSNDELAEIYLKAAQRDQEKSKFSSAAKNRQKALNLQPKNNELRKKLALYYHAQGDQKKTLRLLKKGAQLSPDYPDFNLMLSRLSLKEGDKHKAYLYLNQHPPKVQGNIDYYASYAVLAQQFKKYEQSEKLFEALLSQRSYNGKWRMSLAISQDKQAKIELAVGNYKLAMLADDLSQNAKKYIEKRLSFLESKG